MPTRQQLHQWYKKFSEVLLKNADIDVKNPNDLGRVKNIQITKWDTTNPDKPESVLKQDVPNAQVQKEAGVPNVMG